MEKEINTVEKNRAGLKRGILVNMIFLPMVPFLIVMGISFYFFSSALETGTQDNLARILTDHCRMIDTFLMARKADLELMTRTYSFDEVYAGSSITDIYKNLEKRSAAFVDLGLFDDSGMHLRYSGNLALIDKSYAGEDWFKKTMAKGYYISDIFLGYRNVPHFVVAVRRSGSQGAWVLRATIDTLFFDTLVSGVRMGKTGEAYILNQNGLAQTARRSGDIGLLDRDPAFQWFKDVNESPRGVAYVSPKGQPFLYSVTRLKDKPWLLVVRQEKQDAYQALYSAAIICMIITVCGLIILVVMAVFTCERIIRRIELLDGEKEQLGSQLIRAVQLAEIGEMAAGFAHEINNPLQVIKSEYALLKILVTELTVVDETESESNETMLGIHDGLDQIHSQVERCNKITTAILKFGRKNDTLQTALDPGTVIPEIIGLVENTVKVGGIVLVAQIPENIPRFMGDQSRFQQVLLNLINNAVDAVTQRHGARGGKIQIRVVFVPDPVQDMVEIRIQDNGSGIRPEHLNKIFTPFFTTKAVGKGTGLGLSVCFGIIESFGGTMAVDSRQGDGTVFVIRLPAHNKAVSLI